LDPSRTIEPAFAAYQAMTTDGRLVAGLLVRRSKDEVVLRDSQNKEVVLAAGDVERLTVSRASLMPEGLLAGFTPRQAADLLAYLSSLK
jgi:putative heme-binding domain-containing protein